MPAAAHANAFDDALKEYQSTGKVDGCKHTAEELAQAKAQMPKTITETAPGFPAQLAAATEKRAKGCSKQEEKATSTATAAAPAATTTTTTAPAATTTAPGATQPPAATTTAPPATQPPAAAPAPTTAAQTASSHKGARLALLVAAALVLMLLALWAFARWWAWEPHWLVRWRHATAEAGWRASAAWSEFTDWLRLGR
jgi:cobalamin biosynthesis Mg chelatase CobN